MELWGRLRQYEVGWIGLFLLTFAFVAVLFLRRLLPEGRRHRGRVSVLLLGVAPILHLVATGMGLLGAPAAAAALHLLNILLVVFGATGTAGMLVFDLALGRTHIPTIVRDFTQAVAFGVIVFVILRSGGIHPLSLLTTSAVVTAVIGLALQSIMANVLAGLVLQIDRTIGLGDYIQWGTRVGQVAQINWRSSSILTREGDTAIVPNAQLVSGEVLNLSRPSQTRRVMVRVAFHHRHSPGEVAAVVAPAVAALDGVLEAPSVIVGPAEFVAARIVYNVIFWVDDVANEGRLTGQALTRIWYAAERAGLEGPAPRATHGVLSANVASTGEEKRELARRTALLGLIAILAPLGDDDRALLASAMTRSRWGAGERVLRKGDAGDSLFVVDAGEISVAAEAGAEVARLGRGDCFGEMSLLTGEPRVATCTAVRESILYEIDKAAFAAVLGAHPDLAGEISAVVATRQEQLARKSQVPIDAPEGRARLVSRVRDYFHLG